MPAITLEDPRLLTPVPQILEVLRDKLKVATDEEVFVEAFRLSGLSDAHNEYRMFREGGSHYLPACVQCIYINGVPLAEP